MSNNSEQPRFWHQANPFAVVDKNRSIGADAILCAYCGVVILSDERRAHTANYFVRWGYLHDACENTLRQQLFKEM